MKSTGKILKFLRLFFDKLSSRVGVGGLEISDSHLRFLRISGSKLNRNFLLEALKNLRRQIDVKPKVILPVIVSLPPASVFTQTFSVPELGDEELKEAADLNLQMVSPIERLETAYYHWQKIGFRNHQQNQIDILGAFVARDLVDDLYGVLREAGFYPSAFEFPALAIARVFKNFSNAAGFYIIINVFPDGLDFLIAQDGNLYFNYFHSWKTVQGEERQIKAEDFQNILIREIQKVDNFASTHFSRKINGIFIAASAMENEISEIVEKRFGFKAVQFRLPAFPSLSPVWFGVLGSALRGLMPRANDDLISLARINAEQEYYHYQTISFIGLWRAIFAVFLGFLIIVFAGVDLLFRDIGSGLNQQLVSVVSQSDTETITKLQNEARQFNRSVKLIKQVKSENLKWSPLFAKLREIAGDQVFFDRILIQSLSIPVSIQAKAVSERAAIEFKNKIAAQSQFADVSLPLIGIVPVSAELVSFNMTFKINSLNF
ncbi:MAG: hypothetical protein HYW34_01290 [Candidatus Brennerbacteria bacterium]|nr:hypothetical protein [Candidatus Brennerbacteria bacterium]